MIVFVNVIISCFCLSGVLLCRRFLTMPVSSLVEMFVYMFMMSKEQGFTFSSS